MWPIDGSRILWRPHEWHCSNLVRRSDGNNPNQRWPFGAATKITATELPFAHFGRRYELQRSGKSSWRSPVRTRTRNATAARTDRAPSHPTSPRRQRALAYRDYSRSAILSEMPGKTLAGQLVRRCRLRCNLSQGQLAKIAGTTQSAVSRLESGATTPSFDRVAELVQLMGLALDSVLLERDWDDAAVARNLRLSPQDRWDNAVRSVRFILRGREEVSARRVRSR
jgi:transcriptional regulator with XRE-family HTH domain